MSYSVLPEQSDLGANVLDDRFSIGRGQLQGGGDLTPGSNIGGHKTTREGVAGSGGIDDFDSVRGGPPTLFSRPGQRPFRAPGHDRHAADHPPQVIKTDFILLIPIALQFGRFLLIDVQDRCLPQQRRQERPPEVQFANPRIPSNPYAISPRVTPE